MSYAGDVSPADAYAAVTGPEQGVLVDVRTRAEWTYVGVPVLPADAPEVLLVEWLSYPDGQVNQGFLDSLREAGVEPGTPLYFLCRSGVRSRAAAAAARRRSPTAISRTGSTRTTVPPSTGPSPTPSPRR